MKQVFTTIFCLILFLTNIIGQSQKYSRVEVNLQHISIEELAALGLPVDDGIHIPFRSITSDFSEQELNQLTDHNFEFKVLIKDVVSYYNSPREVEEETSLRMGDCEGNIVSGVYDYETPENYEYGSMGGYLTYDQAITELNKMYEQYPNLITPIEAIDDYVTVDGNNIYTLMISNTPGTNDELKPEVLYTALHHAREPNSLSQMIFYMWYTLENYGTDPYITFLVDNVEMHFIPIVNPDGYQYNESTNPEGGGLWRKNRYADETGSVFGVDLNRNYGFFWGFDDIGSSTNPSSNTFRGVGPFSEIETQAVAALCNAYEFKLALNYHAFGNLLIHPWGYNDLPTEEDDVFKAFGFQMNYENNFLMGTASETVGYTVNGVSDDWFYEETSDKPKIYTYTPEIGSDAIDGFWPSESRIDLLNKSVMHMNLNLAHLALNKVEVVDLSPNVNIINSTVDIDVSARMLGLEGGDYSLELISNNIYSTVNQSVQTVQQAFYESTNFSFPITILDNAPFNEDLEFLMVVDYFGFKDTINITRKYLGSDTESSTVFEDSVESEAAWDNDRWSVTNSDFVSAPSSFTDSEEGDYERNESNTLQTTELINLVDVEKADVTFWAKWDIENNYDYVQLRASIDGVNFSPLCGQFTNIGTSDQDELMPLYDGVQNEWVKETVSLDDYIGQEVFLQFILISDGFVEGDGFYFDGLEVITTSLGTSTINELGFISDMKIFPNPSRNTMNLFIQNFELNQNYQWQIVDGMGQVMNTGDCKSINSKIDISALLPGVYHVQISNNNGKQRLLRFAKVQ